MIASQGLEKGDNLVSKYEEKRHATIPTRYHNSKEVSWPCVCVCVCVLCLDSDQGNLTRSPPIMMDFILYLGWVMLGKGYKCSSGIETLHGLEIEKDVK